MRHTSLETLMERIVNDNDRKHDILADTRRMSVDTRTDVITVDTDDGIESFSMSDYALGQISTDLGIPKRYFDRMRVDAPDLFKSNVHHWLYAEPKARMIRAMKGDLGSPMAPEFTGRAWLSDRYRRLDNIEVATRLLPEFENLSETPEFHTASITDEKLYLRAVFPRMVADIKVGDAVQWGVQIRNSEVGSGTFAIENFVNRLVCSNGMVVANVLNARHVGRRMDDLLSDEAIEADDHAFWLAARDTLRGALSEASFASVVARLRETTDGVEITAPTRATERLAKTFSISEDERETILNRLATGNDLSKWGLLNAVTNAAQSIESFDRQVEMEAMGWEIANMTGREWEKVAVGR